MQLVLLSPQFQDYSLYWSKLNAQAFKLIKLGILKLRLNHVGTILLQHLVKMQSYAIIFYVNNF